MDQTLSRPIMDGIGFVDVCQLTGDVQRMGVIVCAVAFVIFALGVWGRINGR